MIPSGKILQVAAMDAALVGAGLWLFFATGQLAWLIAGVVGGAVVSLLFLVLPALKARGAERGASHVD